MDGAVQEGAKDTRVGKIQRKTRLQRIDDAYLESNCNKSETHNLHGIEKYFPLERGWKLVSWNCPIEGCNHVVNGRTEQDADQLQSLTYAYFSLLHISHCRKPSYMVTWSVRHQSLGACTTCSLSPIRHWVNKSPRERLSEGYDHNRGFSPMRAFWSIINSLTRMTRKMGIERIWRHRWHWVELIKNTLSSSITEKCPLVCASFQRHHSLPINEWTTWKIHLQTY